MSTNLFQRLRNLLPAPAVLIGTVTAVDSANGSSTVQFPGSVALTAYAANVATGPLARVRGTNVAVGKNAFIRAGAIEGPAPDGDVIEIPIGRAVQVAAPIPPGVSLYQFEASDSAIATVTAGAVATPVFAQQTDAADSSVAQAASAPAVEPDGPYIAWENTSNAGYPDNYGGVPLRENTGSIAINPSNNYQAFFWARCYPNNPPGVVFSFSWAPTGSDPAPSADYSGDEAHVVVNVAGNSQGTLSITATSTNGPLAGTLKVVFTPTSATWSRVYP